MEFGEIMCVTLNFSSDKIRIELLFKDKNTLQNTPKTQFIAELKSINEPAHEILAERSGSVDRTLDWGSKGCWLRHCVVSLSKTPYLLLSSCSTQEGPS